jgi:hypothetical protein
MTCWIAVEITIRRLVEQQLFAASCIVMKRLPSAPLAMTFVQDLPNESMPVLRTFRPSLSDRRNGLS